MVQPDCSLSSFLAYLEKVALGFGILLLFFAALGFFLICGEIAVHTE